MAGIDRITIVQQAFDPWRLMGEFESAVVEGHAAVGATSVFVGTMRDFNEGDEVSGMTLEYYEGMTERILADIVDECCDRHQLKDARVVHRVGDIHPGEPIVLVAVWSSHRKAAFDGCREIMEFLKSKAPFWKREALQSGQSRWVDKNTPG